MHLSPHPQPTVFYQKPGRLKVMLNILANPSSALFWIGIPDIVPGVC